MGHQAALQDEGWIGDYWGRAGAGIMFTTGERILLLKRAGWVDEPHTWGIPGGAIPVDDTTGQPIDAMQAAKREVNEEIGRVPPHTIIDKFVFQDGRFTFTTFIAKVDEEFEPRLNHESTAYRWVTRPEAMALPLHPGVAKMLRSKDPWFGTARTAAGMPIVFAEVLKEIKRFYAVVDQTKPILTFQREHVDLLDEIGEASNLLDPQREFPDWLRPQDPTHEIHKALLLRCVEVQREAGLLADLLLGLPDSDSVPARGMKKRLQGVTRVVAPLMKSVAPAVFSYDGFKIHNPERLMNQKVRVMLDGIDYMLAWFKRRHVEPMLKEGINAILLGTDLRKSSGLYVATLNQIHLSAYSLVEGKAGQLLAEWAHEVFLHEFAHHIYETYLPSKAREFWAGGWTEIEEARSRDEDTAEMVEALGLPSEYASGNPSEDFAETFVVFMVDPHRLSSTALFRMKRTLWLAGWYNKPVMRLGTPRVATR